MGFEICSVLYEHKRENFKAKSFINIIVIPTVQNAYRLWLLVLISLLLK